MTHPDPFSVRDRVRRHGETMNGIVDATHYGRARPTVDVYWATLDSRRIVTTEAPENLEPVDYEVLQPDVVAERQARAAGVPFHRVDDPPPLAPPDEIVEEPEALLSLADYAPIKPHQWP